MEEKMEGKKYEQMLMEEVSEMLFAVHSMLGSTNALIAGLLTQSPDRFNGDVRYEWWVCGDYCGECGEMLVDAITDAIQMPERYDAGFKDADGRVRRELELIREQRERRGASND